MELSNEMNCTFLLEMVVVRCLVVSFLRFQLGNFCGFFVLWFIRFEVFVGCFFFFCVRFRFWFSFVFSLSDLLFKLVNI